MNIRNLITVAAAAVFIASMATDASAASRKDEKKRLTEENIRLQSRIDSLRNELEVYRTRLQEADSIKNALLEPAECAQTQETYKPEIEEYTETVSDSLLHAWYNQKNTEESVQEINDPETENNEEIFKGEE